MAEKTCKKCEELKLTGKYVLCRSPSHLIQLKVIPEKEKYVYLCCQSRDGEVQLKFDTCPYCGNSYHGHGGILDE